MSEAKPRLPEIGEYVRGQGTLVAVQDIVPPPPPADRDYIFEEITARVELGPGSEVLKEICTLWDADGLESSVKAAIKGAKKYASQKGIGPKSELEVVVIKHTEQVRKRPDRNAENLYNRDFLSFEYLKYGSKLNLPDPVETVVWSSKEVKP